jgi:uncharacterized protein (TIGR03067 family)
MRSVRGIGLAFAACLGIGLGIWLSGMRPASAQDKAQDKAADKKKLTDQERLQGVWRGVESESGGVKFGAADLGNLKVTFQGKFTTWEQQGSGPIKSTYTLAPEKNPKQIDFGGKAPVGKKASPGLSGVRIYKLEQDRLYLVIAGPDKKQRPAAFATAPGTISTMYVLERVEAKDGKRD